MTAAEAEVVRRSFARRQLGILLLTALAFGAFVLGISISHWTLWLGVAFAAIAGALLIAQSLVWRCPRCGESLGRDWLVRQCPHCFAELTKPPE